MTPTTYGSTDVNGLKVFYRESGPADAPELLLLHGYPSASHMFRDLIPQLADRFHVIAPDLLGFGQSDMPSRDSFTYTFETLTDVLEGFTDAVGLDRYALYVFDYGAPTGFRLALRRPERITAIITQNGNAYDPFFLPAGAEAFKRDIPAADVRLLDTGHFALETHAGEIATAIRGFLAVTAIGGV